jgi:hypothetical protein
MNYILTESYQALMELSAEQRWNELNATSEQPWPGINVDDHWTVDLKFDSEPQQIQYMEATQINKMTQTPEAATQRESIIVRSPSSTNSYPDHDRHQSDFSRMECDSFTCLQEKPRETSAPRMHTDITQPHSHIISPSSSSPKRPVVQNPWIDSKDAPHGEIFDSARPGEHTTGDSENSEKLEHDGEKSPHMEITHACSQSPLYPSASESSNTSGLGINDELDMEDAQFDGTFDSAGPDENTTDDAEMHDGESSPRMKATNARSHSPICPLVSESLSHSVIKVNDNFNSIEANYSESTFDNDHQEQKKSVVTYSILSRDYPLVMPIRGLKPDTSGLPCSPDLFAIITSIAYFVVQCSVELSTLVDIGGNCRDALKARVGMASRPPPDVEYYIQRKDPLHMTGTLELLWNWNYLYALQLRDKKYPPTSTSHLQTIVCDAFDVSSIAFLESDAITTPGAFPPLESMTNDVARQSFQVFLYTTKLIQSLCYFDYRQQGK